MFLNGVCALFCSSWGSEHLLMVIKSIWLQLLRIHVTKLSDTLRRHTNGNSHLPFFFFITYLLFRKSQCTLNICHDIRNTFPLSDPTIIVSSENNSLFPLSGRAQAPWGGSSLSLSRVCGGSRSERWPAVSLCDVQSCTWVNSLVHTRVCSPPCMSTHLREEHQCLCSIADSPFLSLHHSGPPVLNQKVQTNKPEETLDLIRCEWKRGCEVKTQHLSAVFSLTELRKL